ncbi:MAG TPA: DUF350 domain-containing protein [Campylobacterales bacterium]|nr:DUF350 domain-containing protein [Campylobacterales bacterium]HHD81074.1 DUF350 domain-containing protein [Campylobacterales bacterium]HHH50835.1 DUF350 domain-containing protein [Campylobacterales bacterium]
MTELQQIESTLVYALIGLGVFIITLVLLEVVTKFSITKKITQEGNIALAIVLGSIIASLGMIISSAIR